MTVTKEVFVDLSEKYNKVLTLLEDSKSDPPNEPHISKYAARQVLVEMETKLEILLSNQPSRSEKELQIIGMLGIVYLHLGIVSIDTEELAMGESYLQKCSDTINDYVNTPQLIMVTLNLYNQFGILWSQKEPEKSKSYLKKAEKFYCDFKETGYTPVELNDLFCTDLEEKNEGKGWNNFEKIYTFTLYYLAQIYGALKDTLRSAVYCHITLRRQLDSEDYDHIEWALNAATLSQFFIEKNGFKQARHHLAASSYILNKYQQKLNAISEGTEEFDAKMEVFKHRSADVARCWAKYGLLLLSKSKERLLSHTDDDRNCPLSSDLRNLHLDANESVTSEELQDLKFTSLDLNEYEREITDQFVLTIQDAKPVFLNIQSWLHKAELYYTLETLASDHIEIVQDQTQAYLNLIFFEDNLENQAKLHKRRIDLLEDVVRKVNPQYYLQYCRQIWFELAQSYYDILNVKYDKLREMENRPSPHMLTKINHFVERSIYYFTYFIESFKEGVNKGFPGRIPVDFEKAFLQAYFHIGALNSKYITLDKKTQLANAEASYTAYNNIVDYCQANEKSIELISAEHNICEEMVILLPVKISKLTQEIYSAA